MKKEAKSTISGSLPRRYARALISIAQEDGSMEKLGESLRTLSEVFEKSPDLLEGLVSESFGLPLRLEDRLSAIREMAQAFNFHETLRNFLLLLVEKNRMAFLPHISMEYQRFRDEILGVVRVKVLAPKAPGPELRERVERLLGDKLQKKIVSQGEARPSMIGGLTLEIHHTIYDGSVKRELERIKENLLET